MSIAAMRRKANNGGNPRLSPISGQGPNGFSLNGTRRNIGNIGQFRMVSNVTRTLFRGAEPMGSGGCCGTYVRNISNSGSCCTNDPSIVKKTVKNTKGMIEDRYTGTLHGAYSAKKVMGNDFINWVQEDDNSYRITGTQGQLIQAKTQKAGSCVFRIDPVEYAGPNGFYNCSANTACSYHIGGKKYVRMPYAKNLNQGAVTQEQYITAGGLGKAKCIPSDKKRQPFPMNLVHDGCDVNYLTYQQAKDAGALPHDFIG